MKIGRRAAYIHSLKEPQSLMNRSRGARNLYICTPVLTPERMVILSSNCLTAWNGELDHQRYSFCSLIPTLPLTKLNLSYYYHCYYYINESCQVHNCYIIISSTKN